MFKKHLFQMFKKHSQLNPAKPKKKPSGVRKKLVGVTIFLAFLHNVTKI